MKKTKRLLSKNGDVINNSLITIHLVAKFATSPLVIISWAQIDDIKSQPVMVTS